MGRRAGVDCGGRGGLPGPWWAERSAALLCSAGWAMVPLDEMVGASEVDGPWTRLTPHDGGDRTLIPLRPGSPARSRHVLDLHRVR
ncbi:hypothetical protein FHU30_003685 [Actinomadura rupiterrae]|nr:hypothetical protein [Actinomadura rupiterrae]